MVMSNPRAPLPEDAPIIAPEDGIKHGYYGVAPDTEDDYIYTVAGVTSDDSAKSDHGAKSASKETSK